MCAGASVYEALDVACTNPSDHVGVVGIGGLGHMAIQFAKAMGCRVTAFSMSAGRKEDAFTLGADSLRITSNPRQVWHKDNASSENGARIKTLIICTNKVPSLELLLPLLARQATIIPMTIQTEPMTVPFMPFILPGHRIVASTEASRQNHIAMMEFASRHGIKPWVEEFPMNNEGLSAAFRRLETGGMRFRGVLVQEKS